MALLLALAVAQVVAVVGLVSPAQAATALYPDLKTLPPRDLRFATATISGVSHRVLQFSNTVTNVGPGRLDVVGVIDPVTLSGPAYQRVYDDAGNYTQYPAGSLYWHAVHQHFHYENWGLYQLWTKDDYDKWLGSGRTLGQAKKVGTKTTSCIMDEEFISEQPGTTYPAVYTGAGCDLQPDNTLHEGLSPGWGDTYDWYRDEQWIDLDQTPLADGTYVLRSVADPTNIIYESPNASDATKESQSDNEATTTFTVSGGAILDGTAPSGTVSINHTAASTTSAVVTVSATGRDDVSGVDSFRLSDDGSTWKQFTYTSGGSVPTNVSWDLTDPAYGGTTTAGSKTVYAQFHDASGKWGTTVTDTIAYSPGATPPPPTPPASGYAGTVATDGPVGYWRLGESSGTTASDAVGTHTGTYLGTPGLGQPALVPTETNTSVNLTGTSAARMPDAPDLDIAGPLSLEAWIRPAALPASGSFASVVSKPESYSLQFNGPQLEFTIIQNGVRNRLKAPAGSIAVGQTYHVVASYDGSVTRLYLNGAMVASASLSGVPSQAGSSLTIGSWDGTAEFFTGRVDDVAVYGKSLSATQVSNHYKAATGGPVPTTQTVTVSTTGAGSGTVTSSPSGISCPPTCSTAFPSGSTVVLTATAGSGSAFSGWTGGACSGTSPTCTFNAYAATAATASFAPSAPPPPATGYAAAVTGDTPIAYWRLGETSGTTAADAVSGKHPGTYLNGAALGQPSLLGTDTADTSVGLDGVNDSVRIPDSADLELGTTLSVEAWIRPTALPASGAFASVLTKAESYSVQFNGPQLEFTLMQGGVRTRVKAPAGTIAAGQTYHVVATYDGTTQNLYVNGQLVASGARTGSTTANTNPVVIGSWDGNAEYLNGRVDEAAVFGKALSSSQVQAHYKAGSGAA